MLKPALPQSPVMPPFDWVPDQLPGEEAPAATPPAKATPPLVPPGTATPRRLKHGLYSKHPVVGDEDAEDFLIHRAELLQSLRPQDALELELVEQMALARWQLRRIWGLEAGVYTEYDEQHPEQAEDPGHLRLARCFIADCKDGRVLDRLNMHQTRLFNAFHRALRQLLLRQDQRRKGLPLSAMVREALIARQSAAPVARQPAATAPRQPTPVATQPATAPTTPVASDSSDAGSSEIAESQPRRTTERRAMPPAQPAGRGVEREEAA